MADQPEAYLSLAKRTDLTPLAKSRTGMARFQPQQNQPTVPPPANLFQRLAGAVNGFVSAMWTPGTPLQDVPPENTPPRQFDFQTTFNIDIAPRSNMPIQFGDLIALSRNWDILRTIIERRKDQLAKLPWSIQSKDPDKDISEDPEAASIEGQLQHPDNEHDFATFQRAIMEEVFVKDALAIEPVYNPATGKLFGLYGIAGETIQLKIDERGRTPEPDNTAYQQVIKGVPWADFTKKELIYKIRNYSFSQLFGFSAVEQIYVMANIGLRRESQQLYAFTEGTMPAALMAMPDGWTPQQIAEFQDRFDSRYTNNLKKRSKLTMVPHGSVPVPFTADPLKNEFDEWMVRVACAAFGEDPTPWIRQVNRATAESSKESATRLGLESDMAFLCGFWNHVLAECFKRPDLEFKFNLDSEIDPKEENDIAMDQIDHGVLSIDDFLKAKGKDPIGVGYVFKTPQGPISVDAWKANGGVVPAPGGAAVMDEPESEPVRAAKAGLPKGHLMRLPMPNGIKEKKTSKLFY